MEQTSLYIELISSHVNLWNLEIISHFTILKYASILLISFSAITDTITSGIPNLSAEIFTRQAKGFKLSQFIRLFAKVSNLHKEYTKIYNYTYKLGQLSGESKNAKKFIFSLKYFST